MIRNTDVKKLGKYVYYTDPSSETDRPVLGAVVGNKLTLSVDAGNSDAHAALFLKGLEDLGLRKPDMTVLTHWHWDHVFGLNKMKTLSFAHEITKIEIAVQSKYDWSDEALDARVEAGIEIEFCSSMIKKELPDRSHLNIKVPEITFSESFEVDLGGVTCIVRHVGGDHSEDSTVVYVPEDKVVFLGDCIYMDMYHGPWSWTVEKYFTLLDTLLSFDAEYYLQAHSEQPMTRQELTAYSRMIRHIGEITYRIGGNKKKILEAYKKETGCALSPDDHELVKAFIAGYKKSLKCKRKPLL